jgi:hypothetical protein
VRASVLPKIIRRRKSLIRWLIAIGAGIAAALLTLEITREPGPGLDPDSASYLGAAQSLARGTGFRIPIAAWTSADSTAPLAHFPPGYPTTIAIPIFLGASPRQSARFVNAAAAFADVAIAAGITAVAAGELAAATLALMLLVMPAFVDAHLPVLSEPLFLACFVATLGAMHAAAIRRSEAARSRWSFVAGCAAAGALMVRYIGISACGASALWSLLLPGSLRDRLRRTVLAAMPWLILATAWVLRTRHVTGSRAIRAIGTYGGIGETFRQGIATVVAWVVPLSPDDTLPGRRWVALGAVVLLLVVCLGSTRRLVRLTRNSLDAPSAGSAMMLVSGAALLGIWYILVLVASRLFADPGIPFDNRLLLPLFVLAIIIAAISIRSWWRTAALAPRILAAVLVAGWLVASYHVASDDIDWALENGYDLAGDSWRTSAVIDWARTNASDQPLYSNWPSAVVLHLARPSHDTPVTGDTLVLRSFAHAVAARHGVVLAFDTPSPGLIGADALRAASGLRRVAKLQDGSVFVATP